MTLLLSPFSHSQRQKCSAISSISGPVVAMSLHRPALSLLAYRPAGAPLLLQLRGRKRRGYAMKKLAEKRARNIQRRKDDALKPKLPFIERLLQAKMKGKSRSLIEEHPRRVLNVGELPYPPAVHEAPAYKLEEYKPTIYSVSEALAMHRQLMHPTMYNWPTAPVALRLELNMDLERKNKYVSSQKHIVCLPHAVRSDGAMERRSVVAFVADQERQFEAVEAGADMVLGADAVKKVVKGTVRVDDFDFVIAHSDMARFLAPLRGVLKHRLPTRINGAMADDMTELVRQFKTGTQYELLQDGTHPQYGLCHTIIGHLAMEDAQIEENVSDLIKAVCAHRPVTPKLGHFIDRALIMLAKVTSSEYFAIDFAQYAPEIPPDDDDEID